MRDLGLAIAGGDAFEALRTFNSSSESRAALSALVNRNTPKYEQVLPLKAPSIGQTGKAFVAVSREDIVNAYQSSTHAVQAVSDDSVSRRRAEKDIRLPSKNEFMAQTHQERDLANFRLGLSMVASSDYLQAETGIRSVLERAFGGALTYSSPQEIYNTLNERSTNDPELKQTLTELGSVAHSGMSEDEIMNNFKNRR